VNLKKTVNFY